jgi:hypothetical protein
MFIVMQTISLEISLYFHLINYILEDSMQFHVLLDLLVQSISLICL